MLYGDWYWAKKMMDLNLEDAARRREKRRLLREAGIEQRPWLSRQSCWLLCHLGRLLVALGQQLQRYGQPQTLNLKGQLKGGVLSSNGR